MNHYPSSLVEFKQTVVRRLASVVCRLLPPVRRPPSLFTLLRTVVRRPSSVVCLQSAFTLVELLVVIVIIAILMGITIPVSKYAVLRAKTARQEVMLAKIRSALDDYRAAYGEYPITPVTNGGYDQAETSKHYWDNIIPDIDTVSNSIFTNVNLSTNTIEVLSLADVSGQYEVDYCLTFPLMLRQEREGKRPFMNFDKVTVMYIVYQTYDGDIHHSEYTKKRKTKSGGIKDTKVKYSIGDPVDRVKAIDPVSGCQWKYICTNGVNYTLVPGTIR